MKHVTKTVAAASSGLITWKHSSMKCASATGGHVNSHFISHSVHDPGIFSLRFSTFPAMACSQFIIISGKPDCIHAPGRSKQRRLGPESSVSCFKTQLPLMTEEIPARGAWMVGRRATPQGRRMTHVHCQPEHRHQGSPMAKLTHWNHWVLTSRDPSVRAKHMQIVSNQLRVHRIWLQEEAHVSEGSRLRGRKQIQ